jgi:SAM-dependent methyltransferase
MVSFFEVVPYTRAGMNEAERFWSASAARWAGHAEDEASFYARRARLVAGLALRHARRGRSLDVGCGTGRLVASLGAAGFDAYGTDLSPEMVSLAGELSGMPAAGRFAVCTPDRLPFEGRFDLITAIGVFPYVEDHAAFRDLLLDRLAPGGVVIASSTNPLSLFTGIEILRFLVRPGLGRDRWDVIGRLARTGVWSGGFVDPRRARQRRDAAAFDALFREAGLRLVEAVDLHNVGMLDRRAGARARVGGWLARHLGWCHVGAYRRDGR